jgi:hypothetical protein
VVGLLQVDLRKCGTSRKIVGVVVDVPDGVWDGPSVEGSIVATRAPTVVLLEHEVQG